MDTGRIEPLAAYVRVSTQEQRMHGLSLDAQRQKLQEYADSVGAKIVGWYIDEGISGRKLIKKRPALQRMIRDAQDKKFDRIIFIKLDRFFRSVAEYHECMKLIEPVIWTATEEKYDLSTANGRAFVNMKLTIAELEADQTGERLKIVNEYKIKSRLPLFGTNSMPLCYAVKEPEPGERHKHIVKRNKELMEDLIAFVIVNHSVRGGMVYVNNKYRTNYKYGAIMKALKNTMLYGSYKGNHNYCDPYITKEMFDKLQAIITRNPRTSITEYTYIFSGLIVCPHCGRRLTGGMHVNQSKGKSYHYPTYRCIGNSTNKICSFGKIIYESTLERMILARIEGIIEGKKTRQIETRPINVERVSKYNLVELNDELDRLNYSWQKGRIKTTEEYDRRYDAIMAQIDEANNEQAKIAAEPDYEKIQHALSGGWIEVYKDLNNEHKRAFWRSFVESIEVRWETSAKEIIDVNFL